MTAAWMFGKMKCLLPLLLLLSACADRRMRLDLPADAYDVEGAESRRWNQPLAFGPYHTTLVDDGTKRSWLAALGVVEPGEADDGDHLILNGVTVECHTDVVIGAGSFFANAAFGREALLLCGYDRRGARSVLNLTRTGSAEPSLAGELRGPNGATRYEVRSLNRCFECPTLSNEPFGYTIGFTDGRRLAVIETVGRGRVWIAPDAPDRDTLAAAAASLLLFRD